MHRTSSIARWSHALVVAALALGLSACEKRKTVDGQLGDYGRVQFKYVRSCFFGCIIDQPLLAGTKETISVQGEAGSAPKLSARAQDEDIADVALGRQCFCEREDTTGRLDIALDATCEDPWHKVCENKIQIAALAPGDTKVELLDENDEVVDSITVHIREAARAKFFGTLPDEIGEEDDDQFTLATDSRLELRLELYDADGVELLAPEGVTWRVGDPEVATLNAFLIGAGEEVSAGREMAVETHAAGETTVAIDVPGLQAEVDIVVE